MASGSGSDTHGSLLRLDHLYYNNRHLQSDNLQRNPRSLSTTTSSTMGFFASRWIEKHGAANEKAKAAIQPTLTTTTSGLAGPNTSSSEGAGTVKAKWVSLIAIVIISQQPHQGASSRRRGPPPGGPAL